MILLRQSVLTVIIIAMLAVQTPRCDGKQESAQNETKTGEATVYIPFGWKVGDRKRFAVSRTDYRGAESDAITKQSLFDIEIKSETDEQMVVRCLFSIVLSETQKKRTDPLTKQMIELYDELPIEVIISKQGELVRVSDSSELEAAIKKTKAIVDDLVEQLDIDEEKKQAVVKVVEETRSPAQIQQEMLTPLTILLLMTNTTHSISQPETSESTTDLLFARNVPTTETHEVVGVDEKKRLVNLRYTQVVEGESAAAMVREALHAFSKRMQPDREPRSLTITGKISLGVADVVIDSTTGWPTSAQWKTQLNNLKDGQLQMKQLLSIKAIVNSPEPDNQ